MHTNLRKKFKNTLCCAVLCCAVLCCALRIIWKYWLRNWVLKIHVPFINIKTLFPIHALLYTWTFHTQPLCIDTWPWQLSVCAISEVLIAVLLQIESPRMLCCNDGQTVPDILKALWSFPTPGTACPLTQHHTPVHFNLQQSVWYLSHTV